jgi:hypothetical protein
MKYWVDFLHKYVRSILFFNFKQKFTFSLVIKMIKYYKTYLKGFYYL